MVVMWSFHFFFTVAVVKWHNGIELCLAFMICEGPGKGENWLYNTFSEERKERIKKTSEQWVRVLVAV